MENRPVPVLLLAKPRAKKQTNTQFYYLFYKTDAFRKSGSLSVKDNSILDIKASTVCHSDDKDRVRQCQTEKQAPKTLL